MAGAGYNVVIHEFAHKLDMLNGDANGAFATTCQTALTTLCLTPPLTVGPAGPQSGYKPVLGLSLMVA